MAKRGPKPKAKKLSEIYAVRMTPELKEQIMENGSAEFWRRLMEGIGNLTDKVNAGEISLPQYGLETGEFLQSLVLDKYAEQSDMFGEKSNDR